MEVETLLGLNLQDRDKAGELLSKIADELSRERKITPKIIGGEKGSLEKIKNTFQALEIAFSISSNDRHYILIVLIAQCLRHALREYDNCPVVIKAN